MSEPTTGPEEPRTPSTLGIVLHVMEREFDKMGQSLDKIRGDLGDLREGLGRLEGRFDEHKDDPHPPTPAAPANGEASSDRLADKVADRLMRRMWNAVPMPWKLAAGFVGALGIGAGGSGYVIKGCGRAVTIERVASASPNATGVAGTPTPSLRGAAPAMPPVAAVLPRARHRAEAP